MHESSEETAREIDIEVKKLIDDAHQRALDILKEHSDELEKLAQTLLEKETISAAEVDVLLGRVKPEEADKIAEANADDNAGAVAEVDTASENAGESDEAQNTEKPVETPVQETTA